MTLVLVIAGLVLISAGLPLWALAGGDLATISGWAAIVGVPMAATGLFISLSDHVAAAAARRRTALRDIETDLADLILRNESDRQVRLVGTDRLDVTFAELQFVRSEPAFRQAGGSAAGDMIHVMEFYKQLSPLRLVILGEPGSGKTVLAVELLIQLLKDRETENAQGRAPVPVRFSLANWDTKLTLDQWMVRQLVEQFHVRPRIAKELVQHRRVLPVLDGLDEMDLDSGPPNRANLAVKMLNQHLHHNRQAPLVVTSRQSNYDSLAAGVDRATHIRIRPLTEIQITRFLRAHLHNRTDEIAWQPVLDRLAAGGGNLLHDQLRTPWRLTLAVVAYRDGCRPADLLPVNSDISTPDLYGRRIRTLLLDRFVNAATCIRGKEAYPPHRVILWLTAAANHLHWQQQRGISGTDIVLHRWWPIAGYRRILASHATINLLGGFLALVPLYVVFDRARPTIVVFGTLWMLAMLAAGTDMFPEPRRLRLRPARTPAERTIAIRWFAAFVATAWAFGLLFGFAGGLAAGLIVGFGLVAFSVVVLIVDQSPTADIRPHDAVGKDAVSMLALGVAAGIMIGVPSGLVSWLVAGRTAGLRYGVVIAIPVAIIPSLFLAAVGVRYIIAVLFGAAARIHPLRLGRFLDWAYDAGLLRISGVAYQFRHQELQDHLTSRRRPGPAGQQ